MWMKESQTMQTGAQQRIRADRRRSGGAILVVADDPTVGKIVRAALPFHSVEVLQDVEAALDRMRVQDFDLVLCDLTVHGRTGIEVFEQVARSRVQLVLRFVLLTRSSIVNDVPLFVGRHRVKTLAKPIAERELRALLGAGIVLLDAPSQL